MTRLPAHGRSPFLPPAAHLQPCADGGWLIESGHKLNRTSTTIFAWLRDWASLQPDHVLLAERHVEGWRCVTYAEMLSLTEDIALRILGAGCGRERPIVTIGRNGIDLAAVCLAAMRCGVPVTCLSPAYLTRDQDFKKLNMVLATLTPSMIYLGEADQGHAALMALRQHDAIFVGVAGSNPSLPAIHDLPKAGDNVLAAAQAAVTPATIAKILFTSGSTASPKGVINTNEMLCSSQDGHAIIWPLLGHERPVLLDWLPWNHTFGGNFVFNMALRNGGTLYIDSGSPLPANISRTVENLRLVSPTIYFNVPSGYNALLEFLEADESLSHAFFARLNLVFSSGAALPQITADRLAALAQKITGRDIPVSGAWGSTETAPTSTILHFTTADAANIGLPVPGVTIKLAPVRDRFELRVRGPNVTPGYWRDEALTKAAFDEDGFFKMGDAGKLADPAAPQAGILFDGRISENFKLSSGTWVDVNRIRLAAIAALHPLAGDVVVCGHDANAIGLMIFLNIAACIDAFAKAQALSAAQLAHDPRLGCAMAKALADYNKSASGSSTAIRHFVILCEPPHAEHGEITEKGYINQRAVRDARPAALAALLSGLTDDQVAACSPVYRVDAHACAVHKKLQIA